MSPVQMKMARAALDLTVDQLAGRAGISPVDVAELERGGAVNSDAASRTRAVLELAGIQWIDQDGVRFRAPAGDGTIALDALNSANDE